MTRHEQLIQSYFVGLLYELSLSLIACCVDFFGLNSNISSTVVAVSSECVRQNHSCASFWSKYNISALSGSIPFLNLND